MAKKKWGIILILAVLALGSVVLTYSFHSTEVQASPKTKAAIRIVPADPKVDGQMLHPANPACDPAMSHSLDERKNNSKKKEEKNK